MNLDRPLSAIVKYLPEPPPHITYTGTITDYSSVPGIYVAATHGEYTLFGAFIPFADVYFLMNPADDDRDHIYYDFVENGVREIPMKSYEIREQVEATISELSKTFEAFFSIFLPLTEEENE